MNDIGLFDAMHTQLSARGYTDEPVTDEQIERVLEAATWAPNATNRQLWEFIVVRDAEQKKKLAALYRKSYMLLADSLPENDRDVTAAESANDPTLSDEGETAYVSGGDPRTQPKTMLKWSVNLAETMQDVPVLIVVGYDTGAMPYAWDGTFKTFAQETVYTGVMPAVQNLMLAARGVGLGTCLTTVANLFEGKMKAVLGVPDTVQLVALIPLGHPTTPFTGRKRIPWQEKVHWDRW
jgi:nitroreductase